MSDSDNHRSGPLTENQRLGDFEILREIGRGGMGRVYEARQISLSRRVALKVLSGGLGLTPQSVQRFRREAEAAAKLHHTNIVPIYATGEQNGTHFYAMELVEGPSLDQVIRDMKESGAASAATGPTPGSMEANATAAYIPASHSSSNEQPAWTSSSLSSNSQFFDTVARLIAEVADALEYAHQQGVVHRDIKPSNLLLSPDGRLSLNDFGLARVLEEPAMTATGEMLGTPAYMSPEQITAGRTPLDHRTDIYSLGATLYELLTLEPPFSGERRDQLFAQILHKDPRPVRRINKKVPVDLETICHKAMDKDPDRRYQSAGQLADDLRRHVNRFAISARRAGPVTRLSKWARRHPGFSAGLACAAIAIIVAGYFAWQSGQVEQRRLAEQRQSIEQVTTLQRQHALENALVAATSGDLEAAQKAINEAEAKGASPTEVRMLRGQVAFFRGEYEQALIELKQAIRLDPENLSAHSMLAATGWWLGDFTMYLQELEIIEPMRPRTDLEYLLKGYALIDAFEGVKLLDEAVNRSRSPIARSIRADTRSYMIVETEKLSLQEVEKAVSDIRAAREFLPNNLYVLSVSVKVNTWAAKAYREMKLTDAEQKALQAAATDVEAIEPFADLAVPGNSLWCYYNLVGTDEQIYETAQRMAASSSMPYQLLPLALLLCQREQFEEALQLLERRKWRDIDGDFLRVYILAELNPHDLRAMRKSMEELYARYSPQITEEAHYSGLDTWRRLAFLMGMKDEATREYRTARKRLPASADELERSYFDFGAGDVSQKELLSMSGHRGPLFHVRYLAALKCLADGDRVQARVLFESAKQIKLDEGFILDYGSHFLGSNGPRPKLATVDSRQTVELTIGNSTPYRYAHPHAVNRINSQNQMRDPAS